MKIRIQHRTTYRYAQPVTFGQHKIMVRPREGHDVHIETSVLEITPAHTIRWMRDVNGNSLAKVDFSEPADRLVFYSELVLEQYDANPFDFILEESAVHYPFVYEPDTLTELAPYMAVLYPRDTALLKEWQAQFWKPGEQLETFSLLQNVNRRIFETFKYSRRDEPGVQTPAETLQKGSGSCRDFATLLLEACRAWGLAARFASGYGGLEGRRRNHHRERREHCGPERTVRQNPCSRPWRYGPTRRSTQWRGAYSDREAGCDGV